MVTAAFQQTEYPYCLLVSILLVGHFHFARQSIAAIPQLSYQPLG